MRKTTWFNSQKVYADGLTWMQDGLINHARYRTEDFYTDGVVEGLTLQAGYDGLTGTIYSTLGVAYDDNGERINVPSLQGPLYYNGALINAAAATYRVVVTYEESDDGVESYDLSNVSHDEHITDSFSVDVYKTTDSIPDDAVILGTIVISSPGDPVVPTDAEREEILFEITDGITTDNIPDGFVTKGDFHVVGILGSGTWTNATRPETGPAFGYNTEGSKFEGIAPDGTVHTLTT